MNKTTTKLLLAGALLLLIAHAMKPQATPDPGPVLDEAQPQTNPLQPAALEGYRPRRRRGVLYNGFKRTA